MFLNSTRAYASSLESYACGWFRKMYYYRTECPRFAVSLIWYAWRFDNSIFDVFEAKKKAQHSAALFYRTVVVKIPNFLLKGTIKTASKATGVNVVGSTCSTYSGDVYNFFISLRVHIQTTTLGGSLRYFNRANNAINTDVESYRKCPIKEYAPGYR